MRFHSKENDMYIGEQIRLLRKQKGWTQYKLAEKAGLNPNVVSYIESMKHEPRYFLVETLLGAMGYKLTIERAEK